MPKKQSESQTQSIMRYLQKFGSISTKVAADLYGCYCLAPLISDLRKRYGMNIPRPATPGIYQLVKEEQKVNLNVKLSASAHDFIKTVSKIHKMAMADALEYILDKCRKSTLFPEYEKALLFRELEEVQRIIRCKDANGDDYDKELQIKNALIKAIEGRCAVPEWAKEEAAADNA